MIDLRTREFLGIVLDNSSDNLDMKMQGRYKVHIPDIMPHIPFNKGIFVKNHINKWNITSSKYGEYGQHFPIQPFTKVVIKFFENDFNTGYIDRIVSDYRPNTDVLAQDCTDKKINPKDRDEQYILLKTPKFWNTIYFNEETNKEPNTFYFIYNRDEKSEYSERNIDPNGDKKRRTVIRIDETGIHLWTADNKRVRIWLDENKHISRNQTLLVEGYSTNHIGDDHDLHVYKDQRINIDGNQDRWIKKDRTTNIDGNVLTHIKGNIDILNDSNKNETIKGNKKNKIEGNVDSTITGNNKIEINGNDDSSITGNLTVEVSGGINISVNGQCNVFSSSQINANAPRINLNCSPGANFKSAAKPERPEYPKDKPTKKTPEEYNDRVDPRNSPSINTMKEVESEFHRYKRNWTNDGFKHADVSKSITRVRDLGPKETSDYDLEDEYDKNKENKDMRERKKIVGKKCDDVTDNYNINYRESLDNKPYYEGK
jgi:hypothetical protein